MVPFVTGGEGIVAAADLSDTVNKGKCRSIDTRAKGAEFVREIKDTLMHANLRACRIYQRGSKGLYQVLEQGRVQQAPAASTVHDTLAEFSKDNSAFLAIAERWRQLR